MATESGELMHATAVLVGDRGVLITGSSGSGKSSIAGELVDRASANGVFAAVISDDQCLLSAVSDRLICAAPVTLRGGLEVRGSGPHAVDHETAAVIHLVAELVEPEQAIRFADDGNIQLQGVAIPHLALPARDIGAACRAVEAWLFLPPWKKFIK